MNPIVIAVPVVVAGGALAYYLLTRQTATPAYYTPPPGAPALVSGGTRYQSYMKQLSDANIAYSMAKVIGGATLDSAKTEALGTLDVVSGMANADLIAGRITQQDLTNINNQIATVKKTIG